jgi:ribosome-binding factor A
MRLEQVNETILRQMNEILLHELERPIDVLVTAIKVEVSSDRRMANVFFEVYPQEFRSSMLRQLNKKKSYFRMLLAKHIKARYAPDLNFNLSSASLEEPDKSIPEESCV